MMFAGMKLAGHFLMIRRSSRFLAVLVAAIGLCAVIPPARAATVTIESVRLIDYSIDRTRAFVTAKGSSNTVYGIFIIVTAKTDDGRTIEGVGDALPRTNVTNETIDDAWAGAQAMAQALKGKALNADNVQDDRAALAELMKALRTVAAEQKLTIPNPPAADKQLRATLCGFEMALLDLVAQKHKLSMHAVLADRPARQRVAVSALTANADTTAKALAESVAEFSYQAMRMKVGLDEKGDLARLSAVAREMKRCSKTFDLWVDVNQAWKSAETSIAMLEKIRGALQAEGFTGKFICEQPTLETDLSALAAVTRHVRGWVGQTPIQFVIMADEAVWTIEDVRKMVELDAADSVNIKIQKCGGLLEAMAMTEYLGKHAPQVSVYIGGVVATDVTAWANLHLCFALPRLDYATACVPRRNYPINAASVPLRYSSGKSFKLPKGAGLGTGLSLLDLQPYIRRDATH